MSATAAVSLAPLSIIWMRNGTSGGRGPGVAATVSSPPRSTAGVRPHCFLMFNDHPVCGPFFRRAVDWGRPTDASGRRSTRSPCRSARPLDPFHIAHCRERSGPCGERLAIAKSIRRTGSQAIAWPLWARPNHRTSRADFASRTPAAQHDAIRVYDLLHAPRLPSNLNCRCADNLFRRDALHPIRCG